MSETKKKGFWSFLFGKKTTDTDASQTNVTSAAQSEQEKRTPTQTPPSQALPPEASPSLQAGPAPNVAEVPQEPVEQRETSPSVAAEHGEETPVQQETSPRVVSEHGEAKAQQETSPSVILEQASPDSAQKRTSALGHKNAKRRVFVGTSQVSKKKAPTASIFAKKKELPTANETLQNETLQEDALEASQDTPHKLDWSKLGSRETSASSKDTKKPRFLGSMFGKKTQEPKKAKDAEDAEDAEQLLKDVLEPSPATDVPQAKSSGSVFTGFRKKKQSLPPKERIPEEPSPNFLEKLGTQGLFFALLLLCVQAIPDLFHAFQGTALFCPAEAAHITAYHAAKSQGLWLAPATVLPAQWPGFIWLTALINLALPQEVLAIALASLVATALLLVAMWSLCKTAGYGVAIATAACFVTLASPLFAPLVHFYGPQTLAAALVLLGILFLAKGWLGEGSWLSLPLGFLCTGLAGLTGGLFHLVVPLLSSIFFLIWCKRYRRAQRADSLFGFFCLLALVVGWLAYMYIVVKNASYINSLVHSAWRNPWPLTRWWLPLLLVFAGSLPWLLAWIFPSWFTVIKTSWSNLKASKNEHAVSTFIWIAFCLGLALTLCMPTEAIPGCTVCLLCLLTPLLAKTIVRLHKVGARLFILTCSIFCILAALVLVLLFEPSLYAQLVPYLPVQPPKDILALVAEEKALPIMAGLLLITGVFFKKFLRQGDTGRLLLTSAIVVTLLSFPATLLLAPSLASKPLAKLATFAQITAPAKPAAPASDKKPAATDAKQAAPAGDTKPADTNAKQAAPAGDKKPADTNAKQAAPAGDKKPADTNAKQAAPAGDKKPADADAKQAAPASDKKPAATDAKQAAPASDKKPAAPEQGTEK